MVFNGTNGFCIVSAQGGRLTLLFESEYRSRGLADPFFLPSETRQGKLLYVTATLVDPDVPPTMRVVLNWFEQFRNREQD